MSLLYSVLTTIALSIGLSGIPYDNIEKAFEANNASAIVGFGKSKILINILGDEGVYSQSQAGLVLKEFFKNKPGNEFDFVFKGKENFDGAFAIGNYKSKEEKFRVTFHFKKGEKQFNIESLTIERE